MMKTNIYRIPAGSVVTCATCNDSVCGVISLEVESLKSFGFVCGDCLEKNNIKIRPSAPDEKKPINVEVPIV